MRSLAVARHRYDSNRFVLVSIDKIDAAWRAADEARGFYVGINGAGSNQCGKYVAAKREVVDGTWTPPVVVFAGEDKSGIAFTDGRHRFAAARDLGRRSVLVEVDPEQVVAFREKFGV